MTGRARDTRRYGRTASPALVERRRLAEQAFGARPIPSGVEVTEHDAAGVGVLELRPSDRSGDGALLYVHGGGYRLGSARAFAGPTGQMALACGVRVFSVDYRLAPEHPFPAALDDTLTAYRWLLRAGIPAEHIVVCGDSAGGGLAAAMLLDAEPSGLPTPAGAALFSPWVDLRNVARSFADCAATDGLFSLEAANDAVDLYLAGHPATDSLASPVLGRWEGKPPLLIQASDTEVLRDDADLLAGAAREAGVSVQHTVHPAMPHVWHLDYPATPESVRAIEHLARHVTAVTGTGHIPHDG